MRNIYNIDIKYIKSTWPDDSIVKQFYLSVFYVCARAACPSTSGGMVIP